MLKLLIVEDEEETRDGLLNYIPWRDMGFDIILTAKDGEEALKTAENFKPDIILTDIRMPNKDGISLAGQIKESLQECKIIFLSAHSDKEYLKSAIHLKVFDYIEKPVNRIALQDIFKNAVMQCLNEQKEKMNVEESISFLRQKLALQLTDRQIQKADIQKLILSIYPGFPADESYFTMVFKLKWIADKEAMEYATYQNQLLKLIENQLSLRFSRIISCIMNKYFIVVHVLAEQDGFRQNDIQTLIENIKTLAEDACQNRNIIYSGVGPLVHCIYDIAESYDKAMDMVERLFFFNIHQVGFYEGSHTPKFSFDTDIDKQFIEFLKSEKRIEAVIMIRKTADTLRLNYTSSINYSKNIFYFLNICVWNVANERNAQLGAYDNGDKYLWEQISSSKTLDELVDFTINNVNHLFDLADDLSNKNNTVAIIMKYINNNYFNKNLAIKDLANHIFLTPTYLCLLFKKETGKTINQYILEVRIDKAKSLLKDKKLSVNEISDRAGFGKQNYFARKFKDACGMTPTEYREKYLLC